ncbi:MAG TPA: SagB/ThcOx family dehydrogenase [Thermomicrobiaceae bacterium]|nr:SagB/ThcOx family dehydrogenase [Thermomicrobiaceae bacterium]
MSTSNRDTSAARAFHDATKYVAVKDEAGNEVSRMGTPPNVEPSIWQEDWSLEPFAFKIYETLEPLPLPRDFAPSLMPALEAIARTGAEPTGERVPALADLARIGLLANGLLNRQTTSRGGQTIEYRTAGGTGARYHLEIYFACADLPDLEAGVYHYAAHDHSLRRLRRGDYRQALVAATGDEPAIARAPVVLALSSTFWRNAWRYKGRTYRHTFWDSGTTLANALAVAASIELPTRLVLGYADRQVNDLLGIDGAREATVALCALGRVAQPPPPAPEVTPLDYPVRAISPREVEFPVIGMLHGASALASGAEASAWRADPLRRQPAAPSGPETALTPLSDAELPPLRIEDVILKRRSTRHYDTEVGIPFTAFSTLLDRSSRGFAADCLIPGAAPLHQQYLIVNGVEGLEPGVYRHEPSRHAVERLRAGEFRQQARRLAVNQEYAAHAHVNSYYLTNLGPVLEHYGNRGYRLAQLEPAIYAGKLHLGTHALGLGAVGSTSFDDEVIDFFSPEAADASYMFVVVFGKRRRTRPYKASFV